MKFTREIKLKIWNIVWERYEEDCDDSNRSESIDQYLQRKGYLVFQKSGVGQDFIYIKLHANSKRYYLELTNELAEKILILGCLPDLIICTN